MESENLLPARTEAHFETNQGAERGVFQYRNAGGNHFGVWRNFFFYQEHLKSPIRQNIRSQTQADLA